MKKETPALRQALFETTQSLREAGCDSAPLDARLLLQAATNLDHSALIIAMHDTITPHQKTALAAMVKRRRQREPIAYILGYRDFWKQRFRSDARALIPRPETEHLIEAVLARFPDQNEPLRLCDIATGSGCIAISLALEYPNATIIATDLSAEALTLAAENSRQLGVASRITLYQGDLFTALPNGCLPFDGIISNPPYVSHNEMEQLEPELRYEPTMALTDGADGLSLITTLLHDAPRYLRNGGCFITETGVCGLPTITSESHLSLEQQILDLAGTLRGAVYGYNPSQ
ncbi:MAG: peptide chain release factor N(5)-glutamine methyltransferase [Mariprofundales bacterium]